MGHSQPARIPMDDFYSWTNFTQLIHLPTKGHHFSQSNDREGRRHTEKYLDRVIGKIAWIYFCSNLSCTTITKSSSDHIPILLSFDYKEVKHSSQFKFMQMWALHDECKGIVVKTWETKVVGFPMFILDIKLKLLKK